MLRKSGSCPILHDGWADHKALGQKGVKSPLRTRGGILCCAGSGGQSGLAIPNQKFGAEHQETISVHWECPECELLGPPLPNSGGVCRHDFPPRLGGQGGRRNDPTKTDQTRQRCQPIRLQTARGGCGHPHPPRLDSQPGPKRRQLGSVTRWLADCPMI